MPRELRTAGNSFAQFCFNLFGYLPGPLIYGLIAQLTGHQGEAKDQKEESTKTKAPPIFDKNTYSRLPMAVLVYTAILLVIGYSCVINRQLTQQA